MQQCNKTTNTGNTTWKLNKCKSCKLTSAVYLMKQHWIFTAAAILVTELKQKTLALGERTDLLFQMNKF
jgi:hypothetical protein